MRTTWFAVDRDIQNHWLWKDKPFARGQAWIDLLLMARFADGKDYYNGHMIERKKGSVYTSVGFLAKRWGWSPNKVRRFISELEADKMCTRNGTADGTTLTIENWAFYQDARRTYETPDETPDGTPDETPDGTLNYKDTKIYKGNNDLYSFKKAIDDGIVNDTARARLEQMRTRIRKASEGGRR